MLRSSPRRGAAHLPALCLALLASACDSPTEGGRNPTATGSVPLVNFDAAGRPLVRFDVAGDQVDAHGGEIRWFEDRYYMYAETYGCGFEWHKLAPAPFCGFRVYSSPNLVEWTDHGLLFDVSQWEPWQRRCNWWSNGCFRPHVAYNPATRKYVLWVNVYDAPVGYYVLESDTPTGPFVERGVPRLAFNNEGLQGRINNGDHNLFVDDDGTGYIVYTEWAQGNGDVVVERLTPDFLSGTGTHVRLGVSRTEAPSLFKRAGRYYITIGDPNCAYCETNTVYLTAPSPLGPWSERKRISSTSCGGQPGHVSRLPTPDGGSWYLYQSDLWLNSDGRDGGDLNQAPASQFWAPLEFDASGGIQPITCEREYRVDAVVKAPPQGPPDVRRLQCDVGPGPGGRALAREFRFTAAGTGRLRSLSLPTYQRGEPDAPLVFELRAAGGAAGPVLGRASIDADAGGWDVPVNISWAGRRLEVPLDVTVQAGAEYALSARSATTQGCYGFAYGPEGAAGLATAWSSPDGSAAWAAESGPGVRVDLAFAGN
ncbi:MAG TPA: family 43 glycosylhydrolase [Longimicrobiaceae bacterium]|nr:family 43 glycosylhydrolase [Longimicrobiaceae bacterium]